MKKHTDSLVFNKEQVPLLEEDGLQNYEVKEIMAKVDDKTVTGTYLNDEVADINAEFEFTIATLKYVRSQL